MADATAWIEEATMQSTEAQVRGCIAKLIDRGDWLLVDSQAISACFSEPEDPVSLLRSLEAMDRNTRGLVRVPGNSYSSRDDPARGDPSWVDIDRALVVAVNSIPGDDVAIAVDFRSDHARVVATRWAESPNCRYEWVEIAPSFDDFLEALGLGCPSAG